MLKRSKKKLISVLLMVSLLTYIMAGFNSISVYAVDRGAEFIRSEVPDEMLVGQTYPVYFTVQNAGTNSWTATSNYRLGSTGTNALEWTNWKWGGYFQGMNAARAYVPENTTVANGDGSPFNFSVKAPTTTGTYNLGCQMVQDGVAWFGSSYSKSIQVKNIVTDGLPKRLKAGTVYRVTVAVKNTSSSTWTRSGNFVLTNLNSNFTWSNWVNGGTSTTAQLNTSDSISAGEFTSFSFDITAPSTAGTYNFNAQVKSGGTAYGDAYSRSFVVESDAKIYQAEGESLINNCSGTKTLETAYNCSYVYTQGAGNTAMWKTPSTYSSYVSATGEYNIWMKVLCTNTIPLRLQMYGGPNDGVYVDYTPTDLNSWQWIGPLKVNFQSGYDNYQLTLWKMGGGSSDFAGVDRVYFVPTDTDSAFTKKLNLDDVSMSYVIPQTTSGISVNANDKVPVFYKMSGTGSSVIQLNQESANNPYATLRDTTNPGQIAVKVEYLGKTASEGTQFAKFRFTNVPSGTGSKVTDTIWKSQGYGRIYINCAGYTSISSAEWAHNLLYDDVFPGQSFEKDFREDMLLTPAGNYRLKLMLKMDGALGTELGTVEVNPNNTNATSYIYNDYGRGKTEAETGMTFRSGTGTDANASGGSYSYSTGSGNVAVASYDQSSGHFINAAGEHFVYARVRGSNHGVPISLVMYKDSATVASYETHLTGSDKDWQLIGPIRVNFTTTGNFNLAVWRLGGETNDRIEVDEVESVMVSNAGNLAPAKKNPVLGAKDAYFRKDGLKDEWGVIEVLQPPKVTDLYVRLETPSLQTTNKENLDVVLGSNLTAQRGTSIHDWTLNGETILSTQYYPGRVPPFSANYKTQVTKDLTDILDAGYNVVVIQCYPDFINTGNPQNDTIYNYAMDECERLGLKVIPSLFWLNQHDGLEAKTGINFRTASTRVGDDNYSYYMIDPSDDNFAKALAKWYDILNSMYGSNFYTNADGEVPIVVSDEHGSGFIQGYPFTPRKGPTSIESMRVFRNWLQQKYTTNTAWNTAWGYSSNYPAFDSTDTIPNLLKTELENSVFDKFVVQHGNSPIYPDKWKEGSVALSDFDAFRSSIMADCFSNVRNYMKNGFTYGAITSAAHTNVLTGIYTLGQYGLGDVYGSNYNYNAARPGTLGDDINRYCDFVQTFFYTDKEVEDASNYWRSKNVDLWVYARTSGAVAEIYGSNPQMLPEGAYTDAGVFGTMYDTSIGLYPILREAYRSGAVPSTYAWNDYALFDQHDQVMDEVSQIFHANMN